MSAIALSAVALSVAACTGTATAVDKGASKSPAGTAAAGSSSSASSALTAANARQIFDTYVSQDAKVIKTGIQKAGGLKAASRRLSTVAWGVQLHQETTAVIEGNRSLYKYGKPSFILPSPQSGYPRWFAVSAQRTAPAGSPTSLAGVQQPAHGQVLLTFEKQSPVLPWQLTTSIQLQPRQQVPALAQGSGDSAQIAHLDDSTSYMIRPDLVGPIQSTVVDDGPSSTAAPAVQSGPLTTGLYSTQKAIKATPGDIRQWMMEGASYNRFALRMANGGALVFYSQSLNSVTEVPAVLALSEHVHGGNPISVPADFAPLLPKHERNATVKMQTQYSLAFVAIDPPASAKNAKIQIIGMGGSPDYANGVNHG